ncbi:hypothetical protein [Actimicrobium sp. CCI2.3]|uniref:hypothetical protein n=1 Tax=Actimicrobium sp. CCI2.3 TaxID=3048616 RepID=UPI002AB45A39|nr:hypothetical protein [Actimicrobium sp. CCI2.3]MDY7574403.1 hypothetical protein [Actimicrobium sp. CCI2.3]MEB0022518.1 hypothetical protein [Actimicrobium sp. CCI2.3]
MKNNVKCWLETMTTRVNRMACQRPPKKTFGGRARAHLENFFDQEQKWKATMVAGRTPVSRRH